MNPKTRISTYTSNQQQMAELHIEVNIFQRKYQNQGPNFSTKKNKKNLV